MNQKNLLKVIVIVSIIYFIWLFIVAMQQARGGGEILFPLKIWAIAGIILYIFFLLVELIVYATTPKTEGKEIKIVSEVIKKVMCSQCHTTFTISDTGVRPLKYTCPNCGKEGVLRGKRVKGVARHITCSNCGNEFDVLDTGEKPLTYVCPSCHHEGVV
ncbi:MAG TPA: hypothetical protein ENL42_04535 [Thermoplasmatales archaeon]|nr:hypothetical protein [Thermoplasmatales archaeon]